MFLSCIVILALCVIKVFTEEPPRPSSYGSTTPSKPTERPEPTISADLFRPFSEPCRGEDCHKGPKDLIGPILGALCGFLAIILIGILIFWFYLRRKKQKNKEIAKISVIKYIEQPPLYTGTLSTTDSAFRLYGASAPPPPPPRNDSISSHYYEKIQYNNSS